MAVVSFGRPIISPIKTPQTFFVPAIPKTGPLSTNVRFVQYATSGNGSAATGATFGNTLGIGNLIVVTVSSNNASITTPTDTAGHTYLPSGAGTAHNSGSTQFLAVFYTVVTVAQASNNVVCANGASSHIYEFAGVQRVSPVDVTAIANEQTTSGTAPNNQQVGPMTTTLADLVIVALNDNTGAPTAGTLSVLWNMNAPGTDGVGSEYSIQQHPGSITGAASDPSGSDAYCMIMVGFKPAFSVEITPTGSQISSAVGNVTLALGVTVAATGNAITSAVGSVTESGSAVVTAIGTAITSAVGTVTESGSAVVTTTGNLITSAVGTVSLSLGITVTATGNAITSAVGTVTDTGSAVVTATGNVITSATHSVTESGSAIVTATGNAITSAVHSVTDTGSAVVTATGNAITSAAGTIIFPNPGGTSKCSMIFTM